MPFENRLNFIVFYPLDLLIAIGLIDCRFKMQLLESKYDF